ncbi:MAG: histone deacetylase family protein, partial [Methylococcaceae bacterium]
MKTLYYSHPDFLLHNTGAGHPECGDRLRSIATALDAPQFANLTRVSPPLGTEQQIKLIHPLLHIEAIRAAIPEQGEYYLDNDTVLSSGS